MAVLTRPMRTGRSSWAARDRADRRLGGYLLLAGLSLLAVPALNWLDQAVNYDAAWVFENIARFVREQLARGSASWFLWTALAVIIALVAGAARWRVRFLVPIIGAVGPLVLLGVYVLACIYAINSPLSKDTDQSLRADIARYRAEPDNEQAKAAVTEHLRHLLVTKQIEPGAYELDWTRLQHSGELVLDRHTRAPKVVEWLTTHAIPQLHIRFDSGWWSRFSEYPNLVMIEELAILRGHAEWWLYLVGLLIGLYNYWFVNINRISMHGFYRDRLSRTFLLRPSADPDYGPVTVADELRLSQLGGTQSAAPYHLINAALNLQGSVDPQLRERKTVPFVLSQRWCGSPYTGYLATTDVEAIDPSFDLGTAVAISAAAASPNMGAVTVRPLTFLLALLNVRLNYWLPNPAWAWSESWATRVRDSRLGLGYLLAEAFGHTDRYRPFVNCSDGAHIENLGVYELLRRRCQTVICVDAECDPGFTFCGFVNLQRYAEIDLGATIAIDLGPVRPNADGICPAHYAVGTIRYRDGEQGVVHYLKLTTTGDEPEYLRYYRLESPTFPHESTSDQFFDETQFEAYRALGRHVAEHCASVPALAVGVS